MQRHSEAAHAAASFRAMHNDVNKFSHYYCSSAYIIIRADIVITLSRCVCVGVCGCVCLHDRTKTPDPNDLKLGTVKQKL